MRRFVMLGLWAGLAISRLHEEICNAGPMGGACMRRSVMLGLWAGFA